MATLVAAVPAAGASEPIRLRVLTEQRFQRVGGRSDVSVDVRVMSATTKDLKDEIEQGNFREDLFYRLSVVPLRVPSLAERRDDIGDLVSYFIDRISDSSGLTPRAFSEEAMAVLQSMDWPGNIRQLDNMVLRALTELQDDVLTAELFHLPQLESNNVGVTNINLDGSLDDIMKEYEAQVLDRLYQSFPSSRKLAKRLDVSHTSVANKLRDYGIKKR